MRATERYDAEYRATFAAALVELRDRMNISQVRLGAMARPRIEGPHI
jgi:hypothetical protein